MNKYADLNIGGGSVGNFMWRFNIVCLTLICFFYVTSFESLARQSRRKRRTLKNYAKMSSPNNKYRTLKADRKLRKELKEYYRQDEETLFVNLLKDYDTIYRIIKRQNPEQQIEEEVTSEVRKYLSTRKRDVKVKGVKDPEKELYYYLTPKQRKALKAGGITLKGAAENLQGDFNMKAVFQMIEDYSDDISSKEIKKKLKALNNLIRNLNFKYDSLATTSVQGGLLISRETRSSASRSRSSNSARTSSRGSSTRGAYDRASTVTRETRDEYVPPEQPAPIDEEGIGYEDLLSELDEIASPTHRFQFQEDILKAQQEGIDDLKKDAKKKRNQGTMMMLMGAIMIAIGMIMMKNPATAANGRMLMIAGAAMLMMGMQKLGEAAEMESQAKQQQRKLDAEKKDLERRKDEEQKRLDDQKKKLIYRKRKQEEAEQQRRRQQQELENQRRNMQDAVQRTN